VTKTDWIFVQQAKKGDSHAFARLYEIYYKDLYHFALYYTRDSITAEDAVSSAVLKAFEQLHKLRKNDAFKSWLFQITANECKKLLKENSDIYTKSSFQENYGWQLEDAHVFDEPIDAKGHLSLWEYDLENEK